MKETTNRSKILQARLTPAEYDKVVRKFSKTTCRRLSEYVRKALLEKPVTVYQRNQSLDDFMTEMIQLRNELSAIGNNYNQLIKRLHGLQQFQDIKSWLMINESARKILLDKVEQIKTKIASINDQWLQ